MKQWVKKVLLSIHLYDFLLFFYNNLKTWKHVKFHEELKYRNKSPDGLPLPPGKLIYTVIGHSWRSIFYKSGSVIAAEMIKNLKENQIKTETFTDVLDFGCGCGRLIRHLAGLKNPRLFGTDYNGKLIHWCRANLPIAKFDTNQLEPPLSYQQETFDLIYAQSVFTHLSQDLQLGWLNEFHRILKNGGILYFTTHGDRFCHSLTSAEMKAYQKGRLVAKNLSFQGKNICYTFQKPQFLQKKIKQGFTVIDHRSGMENINLRQDVNIYRKTSQHISFATDGHQQGI